MIGLNVVRYVKAAMRSGQLLVGKAAAEVLAFRVERRLLKPVQLLVVLDGALVSTVERHRDVVDARSVPRVIVRRR